MSISENIGSAILLVTFTIIIVILGSYHFFSNASLVQENDLYRQKYDSIDNTFSTLMVLTEPTISMQFNKILGSFFYERSNEIDTPYGKMEVKKTLKPMLDRFFGNGKYYLEAYPVITDISLIFVIDGSPTMGPMREFIKNELPGFLDDLREKEGYKVTAKVYILAQETSLCSGFPAEIGCEILTGNDLYNSIEGIGDPYDFASLTITQDIYSESDWATGVAVASEKNSYYNPSRLEMIIPISDEVNLGSKDDQCFTLANDYRAQSLARIKCFFCNTKSDYTMSWSTVNRVYSILRKNKQWVSPMNALRARYKEKQRTFDYLKEYFGRTPDDTVSGTFCGDSQCMACIDIQNCNSYSVCSDDDSCPGCGTENGDKAFWHPESFNELNDQFFYLANVNGGRNFTIDQFDDVYIYIKQVIDDFIDEMRLSIGNERQGDYLAIQKIIPNPLSNDAFMAVRLKYYENAPFDMDSRDYEVKPIIMNFEITENAGDYLFNCNLKDDDMITHVSLSLENDQDPHSISLNKKSSSQDGKKQFFVFEGVIPKTLLSSNRYNLSLKVEEEDGKIYEINRFYTEFVFSGGCGCDTSSVCQAGCGCDPDCVNVPNKFFWNNYGGTSWDSSDGTDYLPPARNQGSCGACWAFALIGAMEGAYNIELNNPGLNIDLSEQDMISCASEESTGLDGCDGANPNDGGMEAAKAYTVSPGLRTETEYNYLGENSACVIGSASYRAGSWGSVSSMYDSDIKYYLVNKGPLVTVIHMNQEDGGWLKNMDGTCDSPGNPDHVAVIVGYDPEGWIVRNSWGPINTQGHHNGNFKVKYGQCAINKNYYPGYPENVQNI